MQLVQLINELLFKSEHRDYFKNCEKLRGTVDFPSHRLASYGWFAPKEILHCNILHYMIQNKVNAKQFHFSGINSYKISSNNIEMSLQSFPG